MEKSLCGAECEKCGYGKSCNCKGCNQTNGCPFGKDCFIFKYIHLSGKENYELFKKQLIDEINSLSIPGMAEIKELYALNGAYVNIAYPMPNGKNMKLLDDKEIYLGTQVECEFNDGSLIRCFGIVAGLDFLLVSEYGANCSNPEIVVYKKR